jgi:hypothetical protein
MNNMLRNILAELVKVGDEVLGLIYDFLRKLNADKTGEFLKQFKLFLRGEFVGNSSNTFTRFVAGIDREQKPLDALKATGRKLYVSDDVMNAMPKGNLAVADIVFFKPELWEYTGLGWISDGDLEKCFERRNLKPADPYSLAKVNEDDTTFSDKYPNATHWKDVYNKWCFISFNRWREGLAVLVERRDRDWDKCWWFAGLPK